jgi:hypothetical protein
MKADQHIIRDSLRREATRLKIATSEFHAVALGVDDAGLAELFSISFPGGKGIGSPEKILSIMQDASSIPDLVNQLAQAGLSRCDTTAI